MAKKRDVKMTEDEKEDFRRARKMIRDADFNTWLSWKKRDGLYEDALKIGKRIGSDRIVADVYSSYGGSAYHAKDYGPAEGYYKKALELYKKLGDRPGTRRVETKLEHIAEDESEGILGKLFPVFRVLIIVSLFLFFVFVVNNFTGNVILGVDRGVLNVIGIFLVLVFGVSLYFLLRKFCKKVFF